MSIYHYWQEFLIESWCTLVKAVILAGWLGTRISEESHLLPKPMIEVGGKPILWHIMKILSAHGINDFIICAGYKQEYIKDWFANYYLHMSDVTFDFCCDGKMSIHTNIAEPWRVTIVDTGLNTMTGGRIKRIHSFVENESFMLTYGDGVSDIAVKDLVQTHKDQGAIATITAVSIGQKFGVLDVDKTGRINSFREKREADGSLINGGFIVLEPQIFDYIYGDNTVFEQEPLEQLARDGQLYAYEHHGFWHCMDTQRDKQKLEMLWQENEAPWKVWA